MIAFALAEIFKPQDIEPPNQYVLGKMNKSLIKAVNEAPKFTLYVFFSRFDSFSPKGLQWIQAATDDFQHDVRYVALDYDKKDPEGLAERFRIEALPTLVFVRGNTEICRIDKSPDVQLDIAIHRCIVG